MMRDPGNTAGEIKGEKNEQQGKMGYMEWRRGDWVSDNQDRDAYRDQEDTD